MCLFADLFAEVQLLNFHPLPLQPHGLIFFTKLGRQGALMPRRPAWRTTEGPGRKYKKKARQPKIKGIGRKGMLTETGRAMMCTVVRAFPDDSITDTQARTGVSRAMAVAYRRKVLPPKEQAPKTPEKKALKTSPKKSPKHLICIGT